MVLSAQPCSGAAWVGTDDFSSGISSVKWTTWQYIQGQMLAAGVNGHVSYITPISTTDEQSAAIFWNGTPTAADDWTVDISGHNTANWSANGASQLQLIVTDGTTNPVYGISMANDSPPVFHYHNQTAPATNANFGLRLVHRSGANGTFESWYDPKGDGTGWTRLNSVDVASVWPGVSPTNTLLIGIDADSFYGPITEGQLWLDNFRITNSALGSIPPQVSLVKAVKPAFSNLALGTNYQLQVSADLNTWTNQGSAFTATNTSMVYPQYWDVDNWNRLFFRLQVAP